MLRLALLATPTAVLSDDLYRYLWDGRVAASGVSPYAHRPSDEAVRPLRDAHVYPRLNSPDYYSVYPPVSQAVFWTAGEAEQRFGTAAALVWLRGVGAVLELAALLVLARLAPSGGALALYALHPLVLVEAGQGHTELYALPLLAMGLWALSRRRRAWASAAWSLAGAVKLVPFLLVPLLWTRPRRAEALGAVLAAAAVGMACLATVGPYLPNVAASLRLYASHFEFNAPLYLSLKALLGSRLGGDTGPLAARLLLAAFAAGYAVALYRLWRKRDLLLPITSHAAHDAAWTWGGFLAVATTVHPWYLLPVLLLATARGTTPLAWGVAGWAAASMGTYVHYTTGGERVWSSLGVASLAAGVTASLAPALLDALLRRRGRRKAGRIADVLGSTEGLRVLDLGAGEGYVGAALAQKGAVTVLADVVDFHRAALPFVRVEPRQRLPFDDGAFDAALLVFVLHHAVDPAHTLREALRVAGRVVVVESVFDTEAERRVLDRLDRVANRLRSPFMRSQEEHLCFRTADAWTRLARSLGASVVEVRRYGRWPHKQALLVLEGSK